MLIIIAAVLYSGLWYFASQFVQNEMVRVIDHAQNGQNIILCDDISKAGYPLRVGVSCNSFSYRQAPVGVAISTEKLKATAPIYALTWAELSVSSPALIDIPGFLPLSANWKELKLAGDINKPIPDNIILETEDINVAVKGGTDDGQKLFSAGLLRLDAQGMNSDLSANFAFDKAQLQFAVPHSNVTLPLIEGIVRIKLKDAYQLFEGNPANVNDFRTLLRGHNGIIEQAELKLESGGKFTLSGPFSIDQNGYLDATFDLAVGDQAALLRSSRMLFPSQAQNMNAVFFVINSMPKNQNGEPIFKVIIKNGKARLGFIKLGNISPI